MVSPVDEQSFRRWLPGRFVVALLVGAALAIALPSPGAICVAIIVLPWTFYIYVLPYWYDTLVFRGDGALVCGYRTIRGDDVIRVAYQWSVDLGYNKARMKVFAFFPENRWGRPQVPAKAAVPVLGWRAADRSQVFSRLEAWIRENSIDIDSASAARLRALAAGN